MILTYTIPASESNEYCYTVNYNDVSDEFDIILHKHKNMTNILWRGRDIVPVLLSIKVIENIKPRAPMLIDAFDLKRRLREKGLYTYEMA